MIAGIEETPGHHTCYGFWHVTRIMLAVPEMIVHLALERGLDHHLGQPGQQATLPGQPQPLRPGPCGQLPDQLLIHTVR